MGLTDVELGKDVKIAQPTLVNLYGWRIGDEAGVGAFVKIQKNATIGARCEISPAAPDATVAGLPARVLR